MKDLASTLRTVYMYLVALISVIVFIIGAVNLLNTALNTWVFPAGDYYWSDPVIECNSQLEISEAEGSISKFRWETMDECVEYYEERDAKQDRNDRNRDLAFGISMTVVSLPIWVLHMWFIKQDKKRKVKN